MKLKARLFIFLIIAAMLPAPVNAFAQAPQQPLQRPAQQQPFTLEPIIKRIGDGLALNDEQRNQLRQVFAKHEPNIKELRGRATVQPYSQKLQNDVQKEQSEIREAVMAFLSEEQKAKLPQISMQLPVPLPLLFVFINIPARTRSAD